jgi:hypothetical protein
MAWHSVLGKFTNSREAFMRTHFQRAVLANSEPLSTSIPTLSMFRRLALVLCFLGVTTIASRPAPAGEEQQVEELIATLASPNSEPLFDEDSGIPPRYPRGYDHAAQGRVLEARNKLLAIGMAAFPRLVTHVEDPRYSHTEQREASLWLNVSVGYVCYHIVALQAEVYQPLATLPMTGRIWVPAGRENLAKWWESHKKLSLCEIQLEGARWAIERQRKAYFESDKERAAVLGDLERLIKRLQPPNKPIQVDCEGH